jgi:hypothetical protein
VKRALPVYLDRVARTGTHADGVIAAAEALAADPWSVVHVAGTLARARMAVAAQDLGLTASLREVTPGGRGEIARVQQGQPYPTFDARGRRRRGAFDTPRDMARLLVRRTLEATTGSTRTGLDPACGTGAFLLAMREAGVFHVYGTDLDPLALEVARIACPSALLVVEDALKHGPEVDVLCGNPPYVPPERQDKQLRLELRRRFPWLRGRFDLVNPFAAAASDRVRRGGGLGLVLPSACLVQPYGAVLRRRWIARHRFVHLDGPQPFPGAAVEVTLVVAQAGCGPAPLPDHGLTPAELALLDNVPLDPMLRPGDVELVLQARSRSLPLGELCLVDTGLVAHGPAGGKERLLHDAPCEGRVPYADARQFFTGTRRWLDYQPDQMHRAKSPEMFEPPKLVLQRLRGAGPVRAAIDRSGTYLGHTCTVVLPHDARVSLERLLALVTSPIVAGLTRIERGARLDLYPRDVAAMPVPTAWLEHPEAPLGPALGLDAAAIARLQTLAAG